jgi:hypothetical protein
MTVARDVECLQCGARQGVDCQFGNGRGIVDGVHALRIKQAEKYPMTSTATPRPCPYAGACNCETCRDAHVEGLRQRVALLEGLLRESCGLLCDMAGSAQMASAPMSAPNRARLQRISAIAREAFDE